MAARGRLESSATPCLHPRPRVFGADARIRTADLRITNALLYRLSYIGAGGCLIICKRRNTLKPPAVTARASAYRSA